VLKEESYEMRKEEGECGCGCGTHTGGDFLSDLLLFSTNFETFILGLAGAREETSRVYDMARMRLFSEFSSSVFLPRNTNAHSLKFPLTYQQNFYS